MVTAQPSDHQVGGRRLVGLDGIRGLAALFVVVHHTYLRSFPGYPASTGPEWAGWLIYGHFGVVVFIVLSGFSLALAPARHGWRLDGVGRFAGRRARRILPAYWAALVLSVLVAWLVLPQPGQPAPDARSIIVHGLLLQDLIPASTPNRAFWTIAIEAQLYLVFPLLLLIVRRLNAVVMLAAVTVVVVVAAPYLSSWDSLAPQFAILFAIGVAAAGRVAANGRGPAAGRAAANGRVPAAGRVVPAVWPWLALAAAVPVLAVIAAAGSVWTIGHLFWIDIALGPAIGLLLVSVGSGRPAPLVRVLASRPLARLGSFSYSLYLTHAPIVVMVCNGLVLGRVRQGVPSFLVSLVIVAPVTVGVAWLFARAFEFPFQGKRSRSVGRHGSRPEGGQELVPEGVHPPHRRVRIWLQRVRPAPAVDLVEHGRVVRDDGDRDVPVVGVPGDGRGGLVVSEHD